MERCVQCTCYQIFVLNLLFYFCSSLSVARISSAPGASGSGAAPDANKTTNTQNLIDAIVTHKFSSGDSAGAPGSHPMPTSAAALNATVTKAAGVAAAAGGKAVINLTSGPVDPGHDVNKSPFKVG